MTTPQDEPGSPPVREEVIRLLTGRDRTASENAGRLINIYGHPFTARETELYHSATPTERHAAQTLSGSRLKHTDQLEADLARLRELAMAAPDEAGTSFLDTALQDSTALAPPIHRGDVPFIEFRHRIAQDTAAHARAFRAHILPDLGGPARTEALEILERLDTVTPPQ